MKQIKDINRKMLTIAPAKVDFRGALFSLIDRGLLYLQMKFYSFIMKNILFFRGIRHGKECQFWGKTYFKRNFNSTIIIGDQCRFRSSSLSNYVGINRKCSISTHLQNSTIIIGNKVGMSGTVIAAAEKIILGENVLCGANTLITDFDWHPVKKNAGMPSYGKTAPIYIEDNVWLGINVIVLKGVSIGKNSVIGANSVVIKSIPGNVVAAGNPCKVIKEID